MNAKLYPLANCHQLVKFIAVMYNFCGARGAQNEGGGSATW